MKWSPANNPTNLITRWGWRSKYTEPVPRILEANPNLPV